MAECRAAPCQVAFSESSAESLHQAVKCDTRSLCSIALDILFMEDLGFFMIDDSSAIGREMRQLCLVALHTVELDQYDQEELWRKMRSAVHPKARATDCRRSNKGYPQISSRNGASTNDYAGNLQEARCRGHHTNRKPPGKKNT